MKEIKRLYLGFEFFGTFHDLRRPVMNAITSLILFAVTCLLTLLTPVTHKTITGVTTIRDYTAGTIAPGLALVSNEKRQQKLYE
jgi:hypothetical protein